MKIKVGDSASVTKRITDADIQAFGDLSGDHNPLHFDEEHARRTRFRKPISHGMLTGSLFSPIIAHQLPGEGAIYLSQSLKFVAPVFAGDTITATLTAKHVREDKQIITLAGVAKNQNGDVVITGESVVLVEDLAP
ncbi:MAG TPA: MaoC family dehydratase [Pyrinomonadaceae bacterium]|jgi:3-hydroxybutyryl-CoA dehydratase|nr:MaoC family dehydratase [Pyrinomonadaceae bacterium]